MLCIACIYLIWVLYGMKKGRGVGLGVGLLQNGGEDGGGLGGGAGGARPDGDISLDSNLVSDPPPEEN